MKVHHGTHTGDIMDLFNPRISRIAKHFWVIATLTALPSFADDGDAALGTCTADATHLCFQSGRFSATMTYETGSGPVAAFAVQPAGGKPGFFQFADPLVAELWVDLVDGCSVNSHFWVDFLGVSQAGWQLRVDDTLLGNWRTYTVPIGSFGPPVTHTDAFACGAGAAEERAVPEILATTMDLGPGGRFRVSATRPSMVAQTLQLTRDSGLLSFFTPSSPNLLVKIDYPGLTTEWYGVVVSVNQTDVTIEVEDRCTGAIKAYNPPSPTTFQDSDAFPADDELCAFFADGFESGDTSGWGVTK